jgi:hypothetical protein
MGAVNDALAAASRLEDVKFPEFTCKLVTDTFDALVAANIRQQQAYVELLQATSKTLTAYVNDTKDDIGPTEILQLLSAAAPPDSPAPDADPTKVVEGQSLSAPERDAINNALETPNAGVANDNKVAETGNLTQARVDAIMEAAAVRIAANKYALLSEMVRQGMLRLVVEDGTIETRLSFRATGFDSSSLRSTDASRTAFQFRANAKTGGLVSAWVNASASTSYSNVRVRTVDAAQVGTSSLTVDIFGGVKINFRTDYLPLGPA